MNINFKINKEEENVIVSNEKGTMETRYWLPLCKNIDFLHKI